jgi:hypothetical protein
VECATRTCKYVLVLVLANHGVALMHAQVPYKVCQPKECCQLVG